MPCISTKRQLVKWYLAALDAEIEAFHQVTLAQFLDKELNNLTKILEDASVSASFPHSVTVIMPNLDGDFKFGSRFYRNYVYHNYGVTEGV